MSWHDTRGYPPRPFPYRDSSVEQNPIPNSGPHSPGHAELGSVPSNASSVYVVDGSESFKSTNGAFSDNNENQKETQASAYLSPVFKIVLVVLFWILIFTVIACVIYFILTISKTSDVAQTTDSPALRVFSGTFKFSELEFTSELSYKSSEEYKQLSKHVTESLDAVYLHSSVSNEYMESDVVGFREGSVVVDYFLYFHEKSLSTTSNILNEIFTVAVNEATEEEMSFLSGVETKSIIITDVADPQPTNSMNTTIQLSTRLEPAKTSEPETTSEHATTSGPQSTFEQETSERKATSQPTVTRAQLTTTSQPVATSKPKTISQYWTSCQHSTSSEPTTIPQPSTTRRPTATSQTLTTPQPMTTPQPTTTPHPTTTPQPMTNIQPTTFQFPTTREPTTTSSRPTTRLPEETTLSHKECGINMDRAQRIIGGQAVTTGKWPWVVSLQQYRQHICGSAIIGHFWILTAAHCTYGLDANQLSIFVNSTSLGHVNGYRVDVEAIYMHPSYDHSSLDYDVCLLRLRTGIEFSETAFPICLEKFSVVDINLNECHVAGWGVTEPETDIPSDVLLEAVVPVIPGCGNYADHLLTERMMCAGYLEGGIDSCQGDSGGPLMCPTDDGIWQVIGVTSWGGLRCASPGLPGVYANVTTMSTFINHTLAYWPDVTYTPPA